MKKIVMAGPTLMLGPAIHLICRRNDKLDARIKFAHDGFFLLNYPV